MFEAAKTWIQERAMDALSERVDMDENGKVDLEEVLVVGAELGSKALRVVADSLSTWATSERVRISGNAPKKWS